MVSFLDPSQMRKQIASGFKGKLLIGVLTRDVAAGVDSYGDPISGAPQTFRVEGFPDNYDQVYRVKAGIPEGDSKIILIAGLCETEPLKDDKVKFPNFPLFQIRQVLGDPARAHFECQAYEV